MTRKISGHDGDLIVNDAVELDGQITGKLVIEPGGSAVIRGALIGTTLSVNSGSAAGAADADANLDRERLEGDLGSVISDIP
jgi:hypothetical protein